MKPSSESPLKPFLKWAGGKRWFVTNHRYLFPGSYGRYLEPFVGSGAVFFYMRPARAVLADTNVELIDTYRAIREDWRSVWKKLRQHQSLHSDAYYYQVRRSRPRSLGARAARFVYLNRTCFNGLHRVNRKGEFNVPKGTKETVLFPDDDFSAVADALQHCQLLTADFETVFDAAENGDFVYVDPPYTVRHNNNNFVRYNESIFGWNDQLRLAEAMYRAKKRGALVLMSNANARCIRALYRQFGTMQELSRCSVLAADSRKRRRTTELIVTNIHEIRGDIRVQGAGVKNRTSSSKS